MPTTTRTPATRVGAARRKLLTAAAERFYADGVNGTGIDAITAAAGVAKMSLYNNFASKDDLVLAYLQARHEEWLGLYRTRLDDAGPAATPRAGVEAVFDAYIDHADMAYQHGFRGCGLLNAAAELPAGSPGRELVRRHKEEVERLVRDHLGAADLPADPATRLARHLSVLLEGAMSRAGLEGGDALLHEAKTVALELLDDHLPSASRDRRDTP